MPHRRIANASGMESYGSLIVKKISALFKTCTASLRRMTAIMYRCRCLEVIDESFRVKEKSPDASHAKNSTSLQPQTSHLRPTRSLGW